MKIIKPGIVVVAKGPIRIEGFNVEREESDPEGATNEELLLAVSVKWALTQLQMEFNKAVIAAVEKEKKNALPRAPQPESAESN